MPTMISPEIARTVPPRHRHVLDRPRLLKSLQRPAALIVVRGPAGSGKSTLLAEWLRGRETGSVVLWLEIDGENRSARPVWLAVIHALEVSGALACGAAEEALALGDDDDTAQMLRQLVQRGAAASARPIALAIDQGNPFSLQAVEEIVEVLAVTPSLTIGVAMRGRGAFQSAAVRMAVDTVIVDDAELEFTAAETAEALGAVGLARDDATVHLVRNATGGHARATRAALAALGTDASRRRPRLPEMRELVLESLGWSTNRRRELTRQDPLLYEFLVRSAVLSEVPVSFAEVLLASLRDEPGFESSQGGDAAALLDRAERLNLGSRVGVIGERRFRLLAIARNAFVAVLDERPAHEASAVRRFAAQWLLENDSLEEGFFVAINARDYAAADFAAARSFTSLLARNPEVVRQALMPVPSAVLKGHPLLAMMLGLSHDLVPRLRPRAIEWFELAIAGAELRRTETDAPKRLVLDSVLSGSLRLTGQSERSARAAQSALDVISSLNERERRGLGGVVDAITMQSGISLMCAGDLESALRAFRGSSAVEGSRHSLHAISATAGTQALLGEMRDSAEVVAEGLARAWPESWVDGYEGSLLHLARALIAMESFDLDAAQAAVDSFDDRIVTTEHWPLFAEAQAHIDLFAHRAELGGDRLLAARRSRRARMALDQSGRQRLDIAMSTLQLAAGRLRQAESSLSDIETPDAAALLANARLQLVRDAPDAALTLILEAAALPASERVRAELCALECAALLGLGQRDAAAAGIERLAALLDSAQLLTPLALLPGEDLDALRALAAEMCSTEAIRVVSQDVPLVLRRHSAIVLSERERVVLRALVSTGSAAEIADSLFVSVNTVKSQLRTLYRKLGVSSREDALAIAAAQRLMAEPETSAGGSGVGADTDSGGEGL